MSPRLKRLLGWGNVDQKRCICVLESDHNLHGVTLPDDEEVLQSRQPELNRAAAEPEQTDDDGETGCNSSDGTFQ